LYYSRWLQQEWVKISVWSIENVSYTQAMLPLDSGKINFKNLSTIAKENNSKLLTYAKTATWIWWGLILIDIIIILGMIYILIFKRSRKPGQDHL